MASSRAQAMAQANALARRSRAGSLGSGDYVSKPQHALLQLPQALSSPLQALSHCCRGSYSDSCQEFLYAGHPPLHDTDTMRCV
jgi:hypothetical protein